jgi:hypothetical protein
VEQASACLHLNLAALAEFKIKQAEACSTGLPREFRLAEAQAAAEFRDTSAGAGMSDLVTFRFFSIVSLTELI